MFQVNNMASHTCRIAHLSPYVLLCISIFFSQLFVSPQKFKAEILFELTEMNKDSELLFELSLIWDFFYICNREKVGTIDAFSLVHIHIPLYCFLSVDLHYYCLNVAQLVILSRH